MTRSFPLILILSLAAALPAGCASTRIAAWEAMGYAKRDQLVEGVKKARDQQEEAKKQFQSALDQFLAVTDAGKDTKVAELESRYKQLQSQYDRSESAAASVRSRISTVESVADALFREWQAELKQYSSDTMRQASQRQLDDTKAQYARLIESMNSASAKMDPVLAAFKDQTLFLKHNLNARAIASLQQTSTQIQSDVSRLIGEMEASIAEANRFIDQMGQTN
jgi:Ribonuclease G/E